VTKLWDENKILSLKEEGDLSHVTKLSMITLWLEGTRRSKWSLYHTFARNNLLNKGVVDQLGLAHVGLACLQETNKKKHIWTNSFCPCNIDPRMQLSFTEWCVKINLFLQRGDSFKPEVANDDPYLLLPTFWLGMEPSEKLNMVAVLNKHENPWSAECNQALWDELNILTL
jgi:hypothetical protein